MTSVTYRYLWTHRLLNSLLNADESGPINQTVLNADEEPLVHYLNVIYEAKLQ